MTSTTPFLPKAPFLPALGAVLVAGWAVVLLLTAGLELTGGGRGAALVILAAAAAVWVPLLRACLRRLSEFTVSYATSFGVLVVGAMLLVPLALFAALTGAVGTILATGAAPPLLAWVLRHHVDFKDPGLP